MAIFVEFQQSKTDNGCVQCSVFSNRDRMLKRRCVLPHTPPKMVAWSARLVENPGDFYVRGRHTVGDLMAALHVGDLAEYLDTLESVQIAVANVMTDVHCGRCSFAGAGQLDYEASRACRSGDRWKMTAIPKDRGGKLSADEWRTPYLPAILYMYTAFLRDEVRTVEEVRAEFRTYLALGRGSSSGMTTGVATTLYRPAQARARAVQPAPVEREFWFAMCAHIHVICTSSELFIGVDPRPFDGVSNVELRRRWLQKLGVALMRIEIDTLKNSIQRKPRVHECSAGVDQLADVQEVVEMLRSESSTTELVFWEYQAHSPCPGVPCLPVGMIEGSPGHATWSARQAKHCHRVLAHMLARMAIFESVRFADAGLNAQLTEHLHFCHQRLGWLAAQLEGYSAPV
ncbi:uncharacterized protein B0H18DRAFT_1123070 [Fomitopsis serialis]|uniref:uncharacterized protein n=1 Tax=Fomitopsis serialis TaxID=139415 RepID=UPI0020088920|nr:uncharacterized protein B0H18DRAFT_1123070 [Neoantrodia serialis]KAH9918286.1 hypothetical protein B0H18DRAFT_1123070 [Neoantrodia serialis]